MFIYKESVFFINENFLLPIVHFVFSLPWLLEVNIHSINLHSAWPSKQLATGMNNNQKIAIGAATALAIAVGVYVLAKKFNWSCCSLWHPLCPSCCKEDDNSSQHSDKKPSSSKPKHVPAPEQTQAKHNWIGREAY